MTSRAAHRCEGGVMGQSKKRAVRSVSGRPFVRCGKACSPYPILARSGTMRSDTMLMILIIGLTAGPAVSL